MATWKADLSPEVPLLRTAKVDAADAIALRLVVLDANGKTLIEHALGKYALEGNVPATLPTMDPQGMSLPTSASAATAVKRYELQWLHCDYSDAGRTIEEALAKWPEDSEVRFDGALFRLFQGRPAEAAALLQPLAERSDFAPQAKYYLALAKMQTGDLEAASRLLEEVRRTDPKSAGAGTWIRAGRVLGAKAMMLRGRFGEASALLEPVLQADGDYPYAAAL